MANIVISLVGYQGSGKSTIGQLIAQELNIKCVETSDVVRSLVGDMDRSDLPSTSQNTKKDQDWLGRAVYEELFAVNTSNAAVLTGVREIEVHLYLAEQGVKLYVFEMRADPNVRYWRLKSLGKIKTAREFIEHELKEREMGLGETTHKAPFVITTSNETDQEDIYKAIINRLAALGATIK